MTAKETLEELHRKSSNNRDKLQPINSCFYCCNYVKLEDITEWCDGSRTPICPCGVDAVIPGIIEKHILKAMYNYWFK